MKSFMLSLGSGVYNVGLAEEGKRKFVKELHSIALSEWHKVLVDPRGNISAM